MISLAAGCPLDTGIDTWPVRLLWPRSAMRTAGARHPAAPTGRGRGIEWTVTHKGRTVGSTAQFAEMLDRPGVGFDVLVVGYVSRFVRDLRTATNARHALKARRLAGRRSRAGPSWRRFSSTRDRPASSARTPPSRARERPEMSQGTLARRRVTKSSWICSGPHRWPTGWVDHDGRPVSGLEPPVDTGCRRPRVRWPNARHVVRASRGPRHHEPIVWAVIGATVRARRRRIRV